MSVSSWQTETKFNRRDALVALAVALLAAVTALLFYLPRTQSDQLTLVITVGGQEQSRTPVTQLPDGPVRIEGRGGYTLTLSPSYSDLPFSPEWSVRVSDSDCPGQDCIHTGAISRAGQSIVCLPAQVVVYLEGTPAAGQPDVIVG
mgnify:FL=1